MLLIAFAPGAGAIESRDTRGLDVQVESMPGAISVDGVPIHIRIARGRGVLALASRIEQRWRREGSSPRRMDEAAGWRLLGRWEQGRSELIQWRGAGSDAELIFSLLDTVRRPARQPAAPFPLPAGCAWGRAIENSAFLQRSAYCRAAPASLRDTLRALLSSQGWAIRHEAPGAFQLVREQWSGTLTVVPGPQPDHSALVWMGIRSSSPAAP